MHEYDIDNPFYHNYVFSRFDLKRMKISKWDMPYFGWFHTTYVQIADGYVFHYKHIRNQYYITKIEKFDPVKEATDENDKPAD